MDLLSSSRFLDSPQVSVFLLYVSGGPIAVSLLLLLSSVYSASIVDLVLGESDIRGCRVRAQDGSPDSCCIGSDSSS